jgi:hypothetical protein
MPNLEIITTQQHGREQTTHYEQTLKVVERAGDKRVLATLRLTIRTDSYVEQAHAYVDVWSHAGSSWERLHWIAGPCMTAESKLGYTVAYRDSSDRCSFYEADRAELLRVAGAVLGFELTDEGSA